MAKVLHVVSATSAALASGTTYGHTVGTINVGGTEANQKDRFRTTGTFADLNVYVGTNSGDSASTVTLRKNAADTALTVSIGAAATGLFQDTTHSVTNLAGDDFDWKIIVAGTTSIQINSISHSFAAGTSTVEKFISGSASYGSVVATVYIPFNANNSRLATTEAPAQFKFKTAGTLKNGYLQVSSNQSTNTVSITTRINGVSGNITIAVTTLATGQFEDTAHTDTVNSGDLVNWIFTNGDTINSTQFNGVSVEFLTTDLTFQLVSGTRGGPYSVLASTTAYLAPDVGIDSTDPLEPTETNAQVKASSAFTASNLECYIGTNTSTTNGTLVLRDAGASTALTISITANTTGYFEDTTHTVSVSLGDLINYQIITGATHPTTFGNLGFKATGVAPASSFIPRMMLMGVG